MAGPVVKTPRSAVVVIPPEETWAPIQHIRRLYDRQFHRWMPHITLLSPFWPESELDRAVAALSVGIAGLDAFSVRLQRLRHFEHGHGRFTMWLDPEPNGPVVDLQAALQAGAPDCDDVSRFPGGFTPHLSLGQAQGRRELEERSGYVRARWRPLEFPVSDVALICRDEDGPFRVERRIPLA